MKSCFVLSIGLVALLCWQGFAVATRPVANVYQQQEARQVWGQAIAAKGGRERLYAVRNVVVSSTGMYSTSRGKKSRIRQEELYVFPSKFWAWSDYRPDVFGLRVEMVNYDTKAHYIITPDAPNDQGRGMPSLGNQIMDGQLYYLLETEWLKPALVEAAKGMAGPNPVDIVQTKVHDKRIDFAFDRQSHLLVQLRTYHTRDNKEIHDNTIDLSEYIEVNGLKVPGRVKYEGGVDYFVTFQFNVDYNEQIFVRPTAIEAEPEAWRPRQNGNKRRRR